jgi:hypothetical protein
MNQAELASKSLTVLATFFTHGTNVAQGVATRLLGDMVAKRLASAGHERSWEDFKRDPGSLALVEPFLRRILCEDPDFRTQLEDAVTAAMNESTHNSKQSGSINISGSGEAQIGNRDSDHIVSDRVATRGGTYNENTRINNRTTNNKATSPAVPLAMVGAVVLIALLCLGVFALVHLAGGGLSANSTCQEFLNASQADQQAIIQKLATQYDKPDYVTPLGEPEVSYYCAGNPTTTLGEFFSNAQD